MSLRNGKAGPAFPHSESLGRFDNRRHYISRETVFQGREKQRRNTKRRRNVKQKNRRLIADGFYLARLTGIEPATTGSTVRDSNQLSYNPTEPNSPTKTEQATSESRQIPKKRG